MIWCRFIKTLLLLLYVSFAVTAKTDLSTELLNNNTHNTIDDIRAAKHLVPQQEEELLQGIKNIKLRIESSRYSPVGKQIAEVYFAKFLSKITEDDVRRSTGQIFPGIYEGSDFRCWRTIYNSFHPIKCFVGLFPMAVSIVACALMDTKYFAICTLGITYSTAFYFLFNGVATYSKNKLAKLTDKSLLSLISQYHSDDAIVVEQVEEQQPKAEEQVTPRPIALLDEMSKKMPNVQDAIKHLRITNLENMAEPLKTKITNIIYGLLDTLTDDEISRYLVPNFIPEIRKSWKISMLYRILDALFYATYVTNAINVILPMSSNYFTKDEYSKQVIVLATACVNVFTQSLSAMSTNINNNIKSKSRIIVGGISLTTNEAPATVIDVAPVTQ